MIIPQVDRYKGKFSSLLVFCLSAICFILERKYYEMKDVTNNEYQDILINRLSFEKQLFVKFVLKLILQGKITLDEVPQNIRIKNRTFYLSALRTSKNSCNSIIKDLKLILCDIESMAPSDKEKIITVLSNELQYLEINYSGDKQIDDFKKSIPKKILQRL